MIWPHIIHALCSTDWLHGCQIRLSLTKQIADACNDNT